MTLETVVVHPVDFYRSVIIDTLTRDQGIVVRDQFGEYERLASCPALAKANLVVIGFDDATVDLEAVAKAMRRCLVPVVLCANISSARMGAQVVKLRPEVCLINPASGEEVLVAVRAAARMRGRHVLVAPPGFVESLEAAPVDRLTGRETEILSLVGKGLSNRQISRSLGMSEGTVKRHLHNVYRKLKVGSRTEAVRKALQLGVLGISDMTARPA
jgi:DNA-binding NarL/FixJ family response regulator